jgi:hypothetical protein
LGGITPVKYLSSSDESISLVTGASEKSTLGIRINIENGNNSDIKRIETDGLCDENKNNSNNNEKKQKINCAWVLPLYQENSNNSTQSNNSNTNTNKTIKVLERFECLKRGGIIFSNDVLKAKKLKLREEFTDAETGPRSIAQVRRENKKSDNDSGKENNLIDMMENINLSDNKNENGNGNGNENEKKESQIISKKYNKFPENALDLAKTDCDNNSITVMVYWVSRVSGRITRGMHALENVSILPEMPSLISTLSKPSNNTQKEDIISKFDDASDYLSLALKYPTSAVLPLDSRSRNIDVYLDIKSNSKKILIVSAEIVDKKNRATTPEIGLNSSNIDRNPNFHSQRGLRWERKTNFTDIVLLPYEMKSVPFHAVVSMPGAFDLNRYVRTYVLTYERTSVCVTV